MYELRTCGGFSLVSLIVVQSTRRVGRDKAQQVHALAEECGLPTDVTAAFETVQKFFEEVLALFPKR